MISLEFVFSDLRLTDSEDLLPFSVQESPTLFFFRALSLNFRDLLQRVAPFYHDFCHCSQRVAPFYLETLTTTTDQTTGLVIDLSSVCVKEHLTGCGVVVIHVFGEPLLGHGLLIELDVSLCEEVVVGLITCGGEVFFNGPHLLGESAQGYLLLNVREVEGQEEVLETKDEEEEESEVDEKVKEVRENAQLMHAAW